MTSYQNSNLIDRFYNCVDANKVTNKPALYKYKKDVNNNVEIDEIYTWNKYGDYVTRFKNYLLDNMKTNVAIHAFNSPEWFISALGTIASGQHIAGIYNTNKNKACIHVIKTGECDVLVIDTYSTLINHYSEVLAELYDINITILMIEDTDVLNKNYDELTSNLDDDQKSDLTSLRLNIANFNDVISTSYNKRSNTIVDYDSNDPVTLIFTSGTTSDPKGVILTHNNIIASLESVLHAFDMDHYVDIDYDYKLDGEVVVSYLPLSHVAGQLLDLFSHIYHGGEVHFAFRDALKGSLKLTLTNAKPTIFLGVPRVWEKIKEGILKKAAPRYEGFTGSILKGFTNTVKAVNYSYNERSNSSNTQGGIVNGSLSKLLYPAYSITSSLTNRVKDMLGFDRCKYFVTGAAPMSEEVSKYFMSINIPIHEIYGMSETAGVISISDPFSSINSICGEPALHTEIKIDETNNEIMVRGPNVFNSYYGLNIENIVDDDGYFRTGDAGTFVNDKLKITGRIKELIITAGGENIPPVIIETHITNEIKKLSSDDIDIVVMVVGDRKKFLSMLVFDPNNSMIDRVIDVARQSYNDNYAISRSQKVQKFTIINDELTVENGLLTPTMKMKRRVIVDKYSLEIDSMY